MLDRKMNRINSFRYLFLRGLSEVGDNQLEFFIEEAKVLGSPERVQVGSHYIPDSREINSDSTCGLFRVYFDDYILYTVRNESFAVADEEDEFEGTLFCIYSKSRVLDFVRSGTIASRDHPGPYCHYGINCLNHIVDVVSTERPQISVIEKSSGG